MGIPRKELEQLYYDELEQCVVQYGKKMLGSLTEKTEFCTH